MSVVQQPESYFVALGQGHYRATEAVSGAWNEAEQHIAMPLGLMVHAVETDAAQRREDPLQISRLSFDILGTVPVGDVRVEVEVLRPGRTIELVQARLSHHDRTIVMLRAWLLQRFESSALEGTELPAIPSWEQMPSWEASNEWPGAFIRSIEGRRISHGAGRSQAWVRTDLPLVHGERFSQTAAFCGLLDVANGLAVRVSPQQALYPNVDLTASFFRTPHGERVGYDTDVSFGPSGLGVTHSVIHDTEGPVGVVTQTLTVRAR